MVGLDPLGIAVVAPL